MAKGQRRIRGVARRFADYRTSEARASTKYQRTLAEHFGAMSPLARDYAELVAVQRVVVAQSMRRYSDALTKREGGTGRRPSISDLGRLLKRVGLDFSSFDQALRRLEELSKAERKVATPADVVARLRTEGKP